MTVRWIGVTVSTRNEDYLQKSIGRNVRSLDQLIVVGDPGGATATLSECDNVLLVPRDARRPFRKGFEINRALDLCPANCWVVLLDPDVVLPDDFRDRIAGQELDEETLYGCVRRKCPSYPEWRRFQISGALGPWWCDEPLADGRTNDPTITELDRLPKGGFQLFYGSAARDLLPQPPYPDESSSGESMEVAFARKWGRTQLIRGLCVFRLPVRGSREMQLASQRIRRVEEVELPPLPEEPQREFAQRHIPGSHGPHVLRYESGQIAEAGMFANGLADGKWTSYFENGQIESVGRYRKGWPDGEWHVYSPSGALVATWNLTKGRLDGTCTAWRADGTRILEYTFRSGLLDGEAIEWHPSGEKSTSTAYRHGEKHGTSQTWYDDGTPASMTQFYNGRQHGSFKDWHVGGHLARVGQFFHGQLHGELTTWHPFGQKASQAFYINGETVDGSAEWEELDDTSARLVPRGRFVELEVISDPFSQATETVRAGSEVPPTAHSAPEGELAGLDLESVWRQKFERVEDVRTRREYVLRLEDAFVGFEGLVFDKSRIFAVDGIFELSVDALCRATQRGFQWRHDDETLRVPALYDIRWPPWWDVRAIYSHPAFEPRSRAASRRVETVSSGIKTVDKLATVVHKFSSTYYHCLTEVLPRVLIVEDLLVADPEIRLLVDFNFGGCFENTWTLALLERLGIGEDRIVRYDPATIYSARELYLPGPVRCGLPTRRGMEAVRQRLVPAEVEMTSGQLVLLLNRARAKCRRIWNHDELLEDLKATLGREHILDIDPAAMTIDEQLDLFGRAKAIVGVHGAGLANMIYTPRGCTVVEILPADYSAAGVFWCLSNALGLRHRVFVTPPSGRDDDFEVPTAAFTSWLRTVLSSPARR